jgi:putative acetyltransferase
MVFEESMTNILTIRSEATTDYTAITRVNNLAFGRPNEGQLVVNLRELSEFDPRLSIVGELDGEIIGHVLLFPINIQDEDASYSSLSLGPIAVLPDYQKRGIGGQLIKNGHRVALELGHQSVILIGHPSYYPRFGYKIAKIWGLTNPWGIDSKAFMAIELVEGALDGIAGLAVYPKAFNNAT